MGAVMKCKNCGEHMRQSVVTGNSFCDNNNTYLKIDCKCNTNPQSNAIVKKCLCVVEPIPLVVIRPYKQFQLRVIEEMSEHDFITQAFAMNYSHVLHCDGIMIFATFDNSDYGAELKKKDIRVVTAVDYCFMPYTELIKSDTNLTMDVIRTATPFFKALTKMLLEKKEKKAC